MIEKKDLLESLINKQIKYDVYMHKPAFTVNDLGYFKKKIEGAHTKNLFLKNKKNNFFLISCEEKELIDLKKFAKSINLGNLSFAREEFLKDLLGIKPGSVSPFGLLNDINNKVSFYLDKTLFKSFKINYHPLQNNYTITLETNKFLEFMIENKKKINIYSFKEYKLLETL
ncbi:MAG: hypothetical protein CMI96_00590 [Pelagibacteraceae bacterium]|nr:hypothetical protein [Pelagibacteraceae bacterium]|tara:strand:- start:67012 stop:67524 length:513 start_codon:yes stop_codon:yes gene_type:complete